MHSKRPLALLSATGVAIVAATAALVATGGSAAHSAALPVISYDVTTLTPAPTVAETQPVALAVEQQPVVEQTATIDPAALDCMAKVVHHEARNQPREGQLAVARTLINRLKAGRFGDSICAVVNQHGQFFDTASYRPNHDSDTWANAVDVSRAVLSGEPEAAAVVPGAIYFRAAYRPANAFFRGRERVGAIGDHIFYR